MRKIFLIPLLTLVCSVMAWGTEIEVSTFDALKTQLSADGTADVVKLKNNIAYPSNGGSDLLDIQRSLTLDGNGYKLSGYAIRGAHTGQGNNGQYNKVTLVVNHQAAHSGLTVTLKDLTVEAANVGQSVGVFTYDGISTLYINNCDLLAPLNSNCTPLAAYGESTTAMTLNITDSRIEANSGSYGMVVLKPINATINNSLLSGFSAITFKLPLGLYPGNRWTVGFGTANAGARGSMINATNSNFEAPNIYNTPTNGYGTFVFEEDGIDMNFTNCGFNAEALGNQVQSLFLLNGWYVHKSHETQEINVTISGDNSHINGKFVDNMFFAHMDGYQNGYDWDGNYNEEDKYVSSNISVTITGGTYAANPKTYTFPANLDTSDPNYANMPDEDPVTGYITNINYINKGFTIPSTHEVQTVKQGNVTLYRVVKKVEKDGSGDPLYNLNDNVETAGNGQNPITSFELSDGSDMTLNQQVTKAGYVQVMDNGDDATTVTVGKASGADKDQKLIINNGLDVQGDSKVEVKAGSTLEIGEGGITTQKPENIVIDANENGAASLIMDPTITVNQTPELTVKMTAKQIGRDSYGDYYWHRFAMPVQHIDTWTKEGDLAPAVTYPTHLYGWSYDNNDWIKLAGGVSDMLPFKGYTLTLASEEISGHENELLDVTYVFKGNLAGNTNNALQFSHEGYNFFGNSYTGYISIAKLIEQITSNSKIQGTVWVWVGQGYEDISLNILAENPGFYDDELKEIAPMHTFVLKQNGTENASTTINYADAIWGNPRYGHGPAPAPRRRTNSENDVMMRVVVTAANGQKDAVRFVEGANFSDAFENGYDASKFMNAKSINVFATVNGEEFGTVATDNLSGKTITINTNSELAYTISFTNVNNEDYVLRDNVTGQVISIEEGATYEFAAQPNSTIANRFEIVSRANMPTAIENTEVKANVKGIYTIMGQYLGENFDILPAGVYVVDGVKIVK